MQEQRLAQVKIKPIEERPTYKVWLRRSTRATKLLAESAGHYVGKDVHQYDLKLRRRVQINHYNIVTVQQQS